jgi:ABC-2 type transport system permease protein
MNHVLAIVQKDLLQLLRDWKSAFFLVVMPIVFTLMFGFAFSGIGEGGEEALPVAFFAGDDSAIADALRTELADAPLLALEEVETAGDAENGVADGDYAAGVVVPAAEAGAPATPTVFVLAGSSGGTAARVEIDAALRRVYSALDTAARATALRAERLPFENEAERTHFYDETLAAARASWAQPPVELAISPIGTTEAQLEAESNSYAHSSPAMMAQFAIAGLMGAAEVMVLERKNRALHRLLTTAVRRGEILLGHFLAVFLMILLQLFLLMVFGQLILGLPYFDKPGATALLAAATALFAASLGLLIGTMARTEEQTIIFSLIPMFVLAALGGAWLPLELMPVDFQRFAIWTPLARVVEGFKDILVRGLGVEAILPAIGVLAAYAVLCLILVVMSFRSEGR